MNDGQCDFRGDVWIRSSLSESKSFVPILDGLMEEGCISPIGGKIWCVGQ